MPLNNHVPIPDLSAHLRTQLAQALGRPIDLAPLADKGLAHWHVRLIGTGLLARIPKQSQMNLGAVDNLAYEAACFERTAGCGHVPQLVRVIDPSPGLPWGALLVEEINGCPASEPAHIAPIMQALAAIHTLPVPAPEHRPPLLNESNPMLGLLALISVQAVYLDHPALSGPSRRVITTRLEALARTLPRLADSLAPRLISFDAHPGNFLITAVGLAVLVDLEKLRYSYPPLDLAHATLYTSTTWDVAASFELSTSQVAQAYEVWRAAGRALPGGVGAAQGTDVALVADLVRQMADRVGQNQASGRAGRGLVAGPQRARAHRPRSRACQRLPVHGVHQPGAAGVPRIGPALSPGALTAKPPV